MLRIFRWGKFSIIWRGDLSGVMALTSYKEATFYGLTWRWLAIGVTILKQVNNG